MTQLQYTPEQISRFTIPQMACLLSDKPETDRKIESSVEWKAIAEREAKQAEEWAKD